MAVNSLEIEQPQRELYQTQTLQSPEPSDKTKIAKRSKTICKMIGPTVRCDRYGCPPNEGDRLRSLRSCESGRADSPDVLGVGESRPSPTQSLSNGLVRNKLHTVSSSSPPPHSQLPRLPQVTQSQQSPPTLPPQLIKMWVTLHSTRANCVKTESLV